MTVEGLAPPASLELRPRDGGDSSVLRSNTTRSTAALLRTTVSVNTPRAKPAPRGPAGAAIDAVICCVNPGRAVWPLSGIRAPGQRAPDTTASDKEPGANRSGQGLLTGGGPWAILRPARLRSDCSNAVEEEGGVTGAESALYGRRGGRSEDRPLCCRVRRRRRRRRKDTTCSLGMRTGNPAWAALESPQSLGAPEPRSHVDGPRPAPPRAGAP
ncbi:unnamed protein product [Arctogadus glacialis]